MEQLRLAGVHEDGEHLVLVDPVGTEFVLPVDERLRASLRPAAAPATGRQVTPREVQSLIRAGHGLEEVAGITGWDRERIARFEGPIVAEREHISAIARQAHVRGRGAGGATQTLASRVRERLSDRGVDPDRASWDSTRPEGGHWTVVVAFVAGNRGRRAAWRFDPMTRSVDALDDEARWLSEDDMALPGGAAAAALMGGGSAESVDLMTTMRERSRARSRRSSRKQGAAPPSDPADVPGVADVPDDVLPLEDLPYDPATMGLPPSAHGHPADQAISEPQGSHADASAGDGPVGVDASAGPDTSAGPGASAGPLDRDEATVRLAPPEVGAADQPDESAAGDDDLDEDLDDELNDELVEELDDDFERQGPVTATLADLFGHDDGDESDDDDDGDDQDDDGVDQDDDAQLDEREDRTIPIGGDDDPTDRHARVDLTDQRPGAAAGPQGAAEDKPPATSPTGGESGTTDPAAARPGAEAEAGQGASAEPESASGAPSPAKSTDSEAAQSGAERARRKGRPSVPSWDDIMFGAKNRHH